MPEIIPDLVSTIIPVFNRPKMLEEAVQSVLNQTHKRIEILIVDDGSTDETPYVGEKLAINYPGIIKFFRKENSGAGPTRELGRQHARGEFIQYLDSDDLLRPEKFHLSISALKENVDCGAAYGFICVHKIGQPPSTVPFKKSGVKREFLFPWILADRWWNTDCPLFKRTVCDEIGPWSNLRWSQDWEMDGRVAALGTKLVHIPDWVCDERHHATGRQTDKANWQREIPRLQNRVKFFSMMLTHAIKGNVSEFTPERQHFTRYIFATARNCAYVGMKKETAELLNLMDISAGQCNEVRKGMNTFKIIKSIVGTKTTGIIFSLIEKLKGNPGEFTLAESFSVQHNQSLK